MALLKNLDNMITAEEFLIKQNFGSTKLTKKEQNVYFDSIIGHDSYIKGIIEFAKLHVIEALKQVSEKVEIKYNTVCEDGSIKKSFSTAQEALDLANKLNKTSNLYHDYNVSNRCVSKDSILNAYPLNNIK